MYISLSYVYVCVILTNAHLAKILERKGERLKCAKHLHSPEGESHSNSLVTLAAWAAPRSTHAISMRLPEGTADSTALGRFLLASAPIKWSSLFSAVS